MTRNQAARWLPLFIWLALIFTVSAESNPYRMAWNMAAGVYHTFVPSTQHAAAAAPPAQSAPDSAKVDTRPPLVRAVRQAMSHIDSEIVGSVAHFIEYTILGLLMLRALTPPSGAAAPDTLLSAAFLASLACALLDEIHQIYVPGRSFQLIDLTLDALGIALGIWLYVWLVRRFARQA